jgi:hypothetical protein
MAAFKLMTTIYIRDTSTRRISCIRDTKLLSQIILDTQVLESDYTQTVESAPSGRVFIWRNLPRLMPSTVCSTACISQKQQYIGYFFKPFLAEVQAGVCQGHDLYAGVHHSILAWCLFISARRVLFWGLWLATFLRVASGADLAIVNVKPRVKEAEWLLALGAHVVVYHCTATSVRRHRSVKESICHSNGP